MFCSCTVLFACSFHNPLYKIEFGGKIYFVFDLNVYQIFNEKPKKGEEQLDESGEIVEVDTRTGFYPDDIANTFGVPMEQYKKETEVKEMDGFVEIAMLTGVREKTGEAGQQDSTEPAPTPPDPVQTDE